VLVVTAIVLAVVASTVFNNRAGLSGETAILKSCIRYAQSLAMGTDRNWGIRFSIPDDRYWLFYCDRGETCNWNDNRTEIPGTNTDQQARVNLADRDVGISSINQGGNRLTVAFNDFGTPFLSDRNGVLENPLSSELVITLQNSGGATETITVTPTTGFVP